MSVAIYLVFVLLSYMLLTASFGSVKIANILSNLLLKLLKLFFCRVQVSVCLVAPSCNLTIVSRSLV